MAVDLDPRHLPNDEFDRAFLLAHRWALDSASAADLTVLSEQRVAVATATCRVATPAALVAMKLQSAPRRRAERAHKGPNDYGDLYSLLLQPESLNPIVADLPNAPHELGQWCAERIRLEFVTEASRPARASERRHLQIHLPPTTWKGSVKQSSSDSRRGRGVIGACFLVDVYRCRFAEHQRGSSPRYRLVERTQRLGDEGPGIGEG
jgi:hypothetical protein